MRRLRNFHERLAFLTALAVLVAPASALAQATTVFSGGSLTALRAQSPSLVFGALVIDGQLEIDLSTDVGASDVVINASRFEITSRGSIVGDQSACSYLHSPNLTINTSGEVLLDGYIDLSGKGGDREATSLSPSLCPETTCNQCYGADAGDLTIRGQSIRIRGTSGYFDLNANGGWGSSFEYVEYDSLYSLCRTYARTGCSGGDGGRIRLEARSRIDLEGAEFELGGGDGGTGIPEGATGALATLEWSAPLVAVQEIEPNGSVKMDPPLFPGRAQPLGAAPVRVQGLVSYYDDSDDPDAITVTFAPPASNDRLEDLYILFVPDTAPVAIELQAANAQRDLDLYLIDPVAFSILEESNGPPGQVERIERTLARGWYLVGASWCCNAQTLPPPPATEYELRVVAAPEPAGAAIGLAAALALTTLAARHRRHIGPGVLRALFATTLLGSAPPAHAVDRYVRPYPHGSDVGNSCTSPGAPCATIQRALDVAGSGDGIRVSAWTYQEGLRIERALSGVVLEGGWAEDFSSRPGTVLLVPPAGVARPLWVLASGIGIDVTFDRFHISGGNVVGIGSGGGAIEVEALANGSARLVLRDGSVSGNRAVDFGGAISLSSNAGAGSQVILELEDMFLSQNEVTGTNALSNGGGAVNGGCQQGHIELWARRSHFLENVSAGGTLHFDSSAGCTSALTLEDSEIRENADAGIFLNSLAGGAATLDMVNTHILDNGFGTNGLSHAVYLQVEGGTIEASSLNDTIAGNAYGVVLDTWSSGSIGFGATNSILWGSVGADLSIDSGALAAVEYSDLGVVETNGTGILEEGDGNFDADPHFASPYDRRHLGPASPAIDAGLCTRRDCTPQPFPEPPICIRVRVAPLADFEGDPRPTGTGCDVGADEYVPEPAGGVLAVTAWSALCVLRAWRRRC